MSESTQTEAESQSEETSVVVAEPPAPVEQKKPEGHTKTKRQPPYHVIIVNDEEHTFDYVIELLTKLFRHPLPAAEALTWKIHLSGKAIVYTTHREKAEFKQAQIEGYGPDPRMSVSKGPLKSYVEPAE